MCGIVGYVGPKEAKDVVVEGLKKLEYRGYDSSGIAYFKNNSIEIIKTKGKIAELENQLKIAQDALIKAKLEVIEAKRKLEALKKHRERKYKAYVEEENRKEGLMLDEIGILKHARELLESRED